MSNYYVINTDTNEVYNKVVIDGDKLGDFVLSGENKPTNYELILETDITEHPYERETGNWNLVVGDEEPNGEYVVVGANKYIQVEVAPYPSWSKNSDGLWTPPVEKPEEQPEPADVTPLTSNLLCWVEANTSWVAIKDLNSQ